MWDRHCCVELYKLLLFCSLIRSDKESGNKLINNNLLILIFLFYYILFYIVVLLYFYNLYVIVLFDLASYYISTN